MLYRITNFEDSLFDEFRRLQQEMDELFGAGASDIRSLPRGTFPALNVASTPEKVDIYLFAPGLEPKELDISLQENLLTIAGKREVRAAEKVKYYRRERFSGEFRRAISLPDDVDPDRVEAKYRDGVVQISVRRRESARPRQIEIH